jgi:hypothetical protein
MIHRPLYSWPLLLLILGGGLAAGEPAATQPAADAVRIEPVTFPTITGAHAIWGAVGGDADGHIWTAVSLKGIPAPSAHLFEYDPRLRQLMERGDVVSELKRGGIWREGERQEKIHSRIVQAADGHLYFSSMDEEGEKIDGSRQPVWGSHLWRLRLPERRWEHLLATPEALIAVETAGRWVYALGYFGHVLYQFDCGSGQVRSIRIGSVDGHVSRNFLVDRRGHVYVPRLSRAEDDGSAGILAALTKPAPEVQLVELDADLRQIGQTPLDNYLMKTPTATHGITALAKMADGSIHFITHPGWLYHLIPAEAGPATVRQIGPFNPKGRSHAACLFTPDGSRWLMGPSRAGDQYEWIRHDLATGAVTARPFDLVAAGLPRTGSTLLYGSMARDSDGGCYIVGGHMSTRRPILLRIADPLDP